MSMADMSDACLRKVAEILELNNRRVKMFESPSAVNLDSEGQADPVSYSGATTEDLETLAELEQSLARSKEALESYMRLSISMSLMAADLAQENAELATTLQQQGTFMLDSGSQVSLLAEAQDHKHACANMRTSAYRLINEMGPEGE
mmetsp:Transcript_74107/g.167916  ORF Transcript_74107/g.167916 Transcript_74107/m.167916 type:complete len:147 (-) Transcript_74107:256-696(-)|eukprot:CAMPEP_0197912212 /NCGR_PEP_ID=MMETSP1439-20131203/74366_1 /TAXON_ID=66791 /ORGANISM="Gonyaulax spinifera, Strain CCMP409" /LENGTH=146 /DNA_ID=CAMNT_0043533987 /DNA_START=85 /DNA_END=525 /DNA_ORIENTATION=-